MARFYTPIQRYEEFSGATINSRLTQLAAGYGTIGNVSQLIASNTLTSYLPIGIPLDISLLGVSWRWLRFTGAFFSNKSGSSAETCVMKFNNDDSAVYDTQEFNITSTSFGGVGTFAGTLVYLQYGTLTHGHLDLLISPGSTGLSFLGNAAIKPDTGNMLTLKWGGRWRGTTALTSIQFFGNGFAAGSFWRLEGMRA